VDRPGTTNIEFNRGKIGLGFILLVGWLLVSLMPIYYLLIGDPFRVNGGSSDRLLFYGMDIAAILFWAWALSRQAQGLFRRGPALVLDTRGLTINCVKPVPAGFIPWSDIADFTVEARSDNRNMPLLRIHLKEAGKHGATGSQIAIPTMELAMADDELLEHLHSRLASSRERI